MSPIKVLPLLCPNPDCGETLTCLRYDKLFTCVHCKTAFRIKDGNMHPHTLTFAALRHRPENPLLYLPFWKLYVDVVTKAVKEKQENMMGGLGQIHILWVTGFSVRRPDFHGDLGMMMSEKQIEIPRADRPPPGGVVTGISRDPGEAVRYGEIFVTAMLDKRADVTGMEIRVNVNNIELWALPFEDQGEAIIDLTTNTRLPSNAIEDLPEIRKANRTR
jgi:hypothetical protein